MTYELAVRILVENHSYGAFLAGGTSAAGKATQDGGISPAVQKNDRLFVPFDVLFDFMDQRSRKKGVFRGRWGQVNGRQGTSVDAAGKCQESVTAVSCEMDRFRQGGRGSQNDRNLLDLCQFQGEIPHIERESLPGLVSRIMFLVHNNEP